jgi:hypothetical protein
MFCYMATVTAGNTLNNSTFMDTIEAHPATPLDGAFDVARVKCLEIEEGGHAVRMVPYYRDYHAY